MSKERTIEGLSALGMRLFWTPVRQLSPDEVDKIHTICSDEERQRYRQYRHEPSRQCFLVTRQLVRQTLSRLGSRQPQKWAFSTGPHGRPYLNNPTSELEGMDFNIAHSDRAVVLVVSSSGRVGVDLEPEDRRVDHDLVASQFFHPSERRALKKLDGARRRRRFLELWVLKEAWMKADGRGIGAGLKEVVYRFDDANHPRLVHLPDGNAEDWQVLLRRIDDHLLAVAQTSISH